MFMDKWVSIQGHRFPYRHDIVPLTYFQLFSLAYNRYIILDKTDLEKLKQLKPTNRYYFEG